MILIGMKAEKQNKQQNPKQTFVRAEQKLTIKAFHLFPTYLFFFFSSSVSPFYSPWSLPQGALDQT